MVRSPLAPRPRPVAALVAALALVTACSSESATGGAAGGGGGAPTGPCATMMTECMVDQRACVEDAGGTTAHCELCPVGEVPSRSTGSCEAIEGTKLSHDFAEFTTESGEEVLGLCQSWTIGNEEAIWVNTVELVQDEGSHHSNWMYVPDTFFNGEDGVWKCKERGYSQTAAALQGGVLYAQSTQAAKEVQRFPVGAAIRIPPHARVIGDVHILNTTAEKIKGHVQLNVYGMPADDVKIKLAPFHVTFNGLDIPPQATSRFTGECGLEDSFKNVLSSDVKMKIYYALPHTHALGSRFFLEILGGSRDGETIIDVHGFNGEARGRAYDTPIDMAGAKGLRFGCEFTNPRAESVGWGFGDQEMCEVLGFAEMKAAFESVVDTSMPSGKDGSVELYTGPCETPLFVPWSN